MWENDLSFNVLAGGCKEIEIGEFIKQTFTSATDSERVDVKVPTRQLLLIVMISVLENCLPNNIQIRKVPTPKKTTKIHENI